MALITKVKLWSLLPKIGEKVLYLSPIFISSVKQVSEQITPCNLYRNIEKCYCFLLKLMLRVSGIYISFVIYTDNYRFSVFGLCIYF